jgi:flagellar hook-basal body complex protein FliE
MPISSIGGGYETGIGMNPIQVTKRPAAPGFSDHLISFVKDANTEMKGAEKIAQAFAAGETNNIHETMIAAERAVIAFRLVGTVRNRIMEAYNEVMRINV